MGIEERSRALYPPEIPYTIEVPPWRVEQLLENTKNRYPDNPAIYFYGKQWTYDQLWQDARRFARALQDRGIKVGERVALMLPNCPQFVIAYYGTLMAGGIVTQINPLLVPRELEALLVDSQSSAIIAFDGVLDKVAAVRANTSLRMVIGVSLTGSAAMDGVEDFSQVLTQVTGEPAPIDGSNQDVAALQYTGGTTGRSKGAMLTHRNLVSNVLQNYYISDQGMTVGEEVMLTVLPLFHVYGMTVCMNLGIYLGAKLVMLPRFDIKDVLTAIKEHGVTMFPGVPTMYVALLQAADVEAYDVSSVRICNSGSAPMPVELMARFESRTGAVILEGYGLSEASPVTHSTPLWGKRKPGTVGIALPSTECRVVDPESGRDVAPGELGELWIRGPQVMQGYWNRPTETAETLTADGWLRTGDVASYDEEGYVAIMDRLKDLIIASGYNVYPREVEEVLYQHPDVVEAVVVGAPDAYRGETVRAVVVPRKDSGLTVEALTQYLNANLAAYKRPKIIEFREQLPKSAVGKILRRVVRDEI
ncbi:long-chain-fatty-acid--CoA ligase [Sulfobacillus harzensis]|uniref:Long-chain fatty acid--CoA ligase n=1 Tax=Sulfobacillus harzensis TaxID=2729629 RepID=A0A7Y0Q3L8_9FIRM|nr:long-chain fatty acid--CoA ligase [Sulfobacillus harzensis]NMP23525.1 long-chain fatty acid--CoA ligase [Sulfobacillus harzensis]